MCPHVSIGSQQPCMCGGMGDVHVSPVEAAPGAQEHPRGKVSGVSS